ncbi:type II toxin-antitoxin system VapC family toxin [Candidatus Burkholderia verschuerenii]|uniref:type II toxin-antitoxin system VapC family toxin n=1 Tax=Candidatus Burkholderia verschuerenii TaxID=242163 RepID=UPI00067BCA42|nr:type II toxin-antitoxin system VapC family toxin [Candidatus Burkholderia verschuerenii]
MYLADTNVISERRKDERANKGVRDFFCQADEQNHKIHLSVVAIAEVRRGVNLARYKGDEKQAVVLERWLSAIVRDYAQLILKVDKEISDLWGRLRVPHPEPALDMLIAATAIHHGLTVVTRNVKDFEKTGVKTLNPFV